MSQQVIGKEQQQAAMTQTPFPRHRHRPPWNQITCQLIADHVFA